MGVEIGYTLSSEERTPAQLLGDAEKAEEAGFGFAVISDHFHPWIERQGNSPFVWSILGALATRTSLRLGTGVTCPTMRVHPAIVAQASATVAAMAPGRFFLGLGTGENLNEHIVAQGWPAAAQRLERLEEAVQIIRSLWEGELHTHRGTYFEVENAKLYTLPEPAPEIYMAAAGKDAATLAGRCADGLIGTSPDPEIQEAFSAAGGAGKPRYGQLTVCWAEDAARALSTVREWWPNAGLQGELTQELPLPRHFEQAVATVGDDALTETVTCGPDVGAFVSAITRYAEAGYTHVYLHQVGADQEGFFRFFREELQPELGTELVASARS
jgi:coenzyme F420-dependent glucose-6-phosphate dehydrogenase